MLVKEEAVVEQMQRCDILNLHKYFFEVHFQPFPYFTLFCLFRASFAFSSFVFAKRSFASVYEAMLPFFDWFLDQLHYSPAVRVDIDARNLGQDLKESEDTNIVIVEITCRNLEITMSIPIRIRTSRLPGPLRWFLSRKTFMVWSGNY